MIIYTKVKGCRFGGTLCVLCYLSFFMDLTKSIDFFDDI